MQPYLATNKLSLYEKKTLFLLHCRNLDTKSNMKSLFDQGDMSCQLCSLSNSFEDKNHLIHCKELLVKENQHNSKFEDVYAQLEKQISVVELFIKIIERRNLLSELPGL